MYKNIIGILMISIILSACTNTSTSLKEDASFTENTATDQTWETNNDIADHLADIATKVPDVDGAISIVAGPYAVVAIDVDEKIDRQRVGTIKFSVNEALRDDPYGKTAIVVADPDISERIRNMRSRISEGEPIIAIVDELAELVGRVIPTLPVEEKTGQRKEEEINLNQVEPDNRKQNQLTIEP